MTPKIQTQLLWALLVFLFCAATRSPLERDPVTHILVQLPLLALVGWLVASALRKRIPVAHLCSDHGMACLLIALFSIAYWMLPRSIDAALEDPQMELAKFLSVPLLIGLPLGLGWQRAHPLVKGFLKANALSMLGVLAFLFTHAPVRICNNYLVSDQERLGLGFLYAAFALTVLWVIPLFTGSGAGERDTIPSVMARRAKA